MKKYLFVISLAFLSQTNLIAQDLGDSVSEKNISETLNWLASDSLKGRGNFKPELVTAAAFISGKFSDYGLQPFPGDFNFHQPFNAGSSKAIYRDLVDWDGLRLDQSQFIYITRDILPPDKKLDDFKLVEYTGDFADSVFQAHWYDSSNTLIVWKNNSSARQKIPLEDFHHPGFPPVANILFVSASKIPKTIRVFVNEQYRKNILFNVIGMLPGRTKPNEIVIFSAHYDHIGSSNGSGDIIFNGANDDASGVTAVLELAKYFSLKRDNERTIFFCAFAGEEIGLMGSSFLASMLKPEHVIAVINIEMIGRWEAAGENSFILTGNRYSNLEAILAKNLRNDPVKIIRDSENGKLFQRSDNYSFALKGIPAHSIMCSDDGDPCYHKTCDDSKRIDISNMTRIIKAIAKATRTIISAQETPQRINIQELKN